MLRTAALVAVVLLLAGCGTPTPAAQPLAFDGDAAYAMVAGLVSDPAGAPRFRVPGTAGHDEAREWIWQQLQVPGWTAFRQPFTGADYDALDKGAVRGYTDSPSYCDDEERARTSGLEFENFWAVHDGTSSAAIVWLGAHWESKRHASQDPDATRRQDPVLGANDGASGAGVLLHLMRHIDDAGIEFPFQVGVVLFDGEDGFEDCHPLAGSLYFVDTLGPPPDAVDNRRRMLLLDMVGDPQARFIRESRSARCDPGLVDLLHTLAPDVGLEPNFPGTSKSVVDDHIPFLDAGIPAVDLIDFGRSTNFGFPPYWHTTGDTLDKLDAAMLGRVGDLVLAALQDPAFVRDWPQGC